MDFYGLRKEVGRSGEDVVEVQQPDDFGRASKNKRAVALGRFLESKRTKRVEENLQEDFGVMRQIRMGRVLWGDPFKKRVLWGRNSYG